MSPGSLALAGRCVYVGLGTLGKQNEYYILVVDVVCAALRSRRSGGERVLVFIGVRLCIFIKILYAYTKTKYLESGLTLAKLR